MTKYFEKISILTAAIGFLFLCGTLYIIGFWITFDFDITTYVDILDIPKSFVFPMAAAVGLSALSIAYQIIIRMYPANKKQAPDTPHKPDRLFLFLSKIEIWVYALISLVGLSILFYFSKEAFYFLSTFLIGIFLAKDVSRVLVASGLTNPYVLWATLLIICFLPTGSFTIGKLESLGIYNNEDYFKVTHIDYMTPSGGKLEEVNLKLIGKLGSFVFLTDSLNSKIVTVNLSFVKQIEYRRVKKPSKFEPKPATSSVKPAPPPHTSDSLCKADSLYH